MSRVITPDQHGAWRALFEDYQRSAYRLEGLQTYTDHRETEYFQKFVAGEAPDVDLSWWTGMVKRHKAAGYSMSRVRVIREPLTDYTRFELSLYPRLVAAGDEIRIIVANEDEPALPDHDYWLFNDTDLWIMDYEGPGIFTGARLVEDEAVVAQHCEWRDTALELSVPLDEYLSTLTT